MQTTQIRLFSTPPANRGSLRRNQADSRPDAAAFARLCRGCARCARLCAVAWWRAVASPAPGSGRGFNWKREREWKGGRDLGFRWRGNFFYREERKLSLRSERKGEGTFCIEALINLVINKITHPPSCHLAKARIKMILALDQISPCTPNPFH